MYESVRMWARGYWHKDYVSISQKDACESLWGALGIKPHFQRSPQKVVHSSFIKKRITTPSPLLFLPSPSLTLFPSALPDQTDPRACHDLISFRFTPTYPVAFLWPRIPQANQLGQAHLQASQINQALLTHKHTSFTWKLKAITLKYISTLENYSQQKMKAKSFCIRIQLNLLRLMSRCL